MSVKHFQLILGALEIGLPDDGDQEISYQMPHIFENLHPPTAVRAIVTIDGEDYEVTVRPSRDREAYPQESKQDDTGRL